MLNQGDGTVSRIDTASNEVVATIDAGVPGRGGDISVGQGFVWVTLISIPLTQINPTTNSVVRRWENRPVRFEVFRIASFPGKAGDDFVLSRVRPVEGGVIV